MKKVRILTFFALAALVTSCGGEEEKEKSGPSEELKKEIDALRDEGRAAGQESDTYLQELVGLVDAFKNSGLVDSLMAKVEGLDPLVKAGAEIYLKNALESSTLADDLVARAQEELAAHNETGKEFMDWLKKVENGDISEEDAKKQIEMWRRKLEDQRAALESWKEQWENIQTMQKTAVDAVNGLLETVK
jgi:hypothetical protein